MGDPPVRSDTIRGFLAVAFWSTTVAVSRDVIQQVGVLPAAFYLLLGSGILLTLLQLLKSPRDFRRSLQGLPFRYFYRAGIFLILYMITFYLAMGLAESIPALLVVGLLNYLWPVFGYLLAIPVFKTRPRMGLLLSGILAAVAGTILALLSRGDVMAGDLLTAFQRNRVPYGLALTAALFWGLYSNLTRKHQVPGDQAALPLLFVFSSLVVLVVMLVRGEIPRFPLPASHLPAFGYMVVFPTSLAYFFWDRAMKRGNRELVLAVAYLIPLFSTLVTVVYFSADLTVTLLLAAALIIGGAVFSHRSVRG